MQTSNLTGAVSLRKLSSSRPCSPGGASYDSTPADIHAYDVVTGKPVWTFHVIPHPGEFGYETWPPDAWKTIGGVHNWNEMTVDEKRGIAYFPLGTARYDFYGANRKGNDLFANSVLALDARTGKRLWHYQLIHHDLWDYDLPVAPKLLTVKHNGKNVDVVAQATKFGFPVRLRPRDGRKPLWPIEERAVPQSRRSGRVEFPEAAVPNQASAIRAAILHGEGHQSVRNGGGAGSHSRDAPECAQRRAVHTAQFARLDFLSWSQWGRQLGHGGGRPGEGIFLRDHEGTPNARQIVVAGRGSRWKRRGERRAARRAPGASRHQLCSL